MIYFRISLPKTNSTWETREGCLRTISVVPLLWYASEPCFSFVLHRRDSKGVCKSRICFSTFSSPLTTTHRCPCFLTLRPQIINLTCRQPVKRLTSMDASLLRPTPPLSGTQPRLGCRPALSAMRATRARNVRWWFIAAPARHSCANRVRTKYMFLKQLVSMSGWRLRITSRSSAAWAIPPPQITK